MAKALRNSGYALAHAAWSVETGGTLCTLAFLATGDGRRVLNRYEADNIPASIDLAHLHLNRVLGEDDYAALVWTTRRNRHPSSLPRPAT